MVTPSGLAVTWTHDARRGLICGAPADVAQALTALLRRVVSAESGAAPELLP